jgi:hypothetical protein
MTYPMGGLDLNGVLSTAWTLYRRAQGALVRVVAIVVIPVHLLVLLMAELGEGDGAERSNGSVEVDGSELLGSLSRTVATLALTMVSAQLASGASLRLLVGAAVDRTPGWRESLRFARAHLAGLLGLALLSGLLLGVGFLLLIVPGIYLYAAWSVATPALLVERTGISGALDRSRQLVRGRWGPVAGALLVANLLVGVVGLLGVPFLIGGDLDDPSLTTLVITNVIGIVAQLFTVPYLAAVSVVLYLDLRVRKEGIHPEHVAAELGLDPPVDDRGTVIPPPPPAIPPPPPFEPG